LASFGLATGPAWISGIATVLAADRQVMPAPLPPASVFLKRNWKVRSSFASPLLSTWISYSAFGSIAK
jgi:hypothetical protein